ncbi:MAG: hypothetical protein JWR80_8807 [Bradyrhizobium sp.]|jgi:DNA-binding MarR family transcriptional regulator|nr:hypothetical protein [Bradyrhizobium sp.]
MKSDRSVGVQISLLARLFRTRFDQRARTVGLTRPQWRMIVAIRFAEGATQREIAEILEVEPVTVARIIDRLEAAHLVERRPDAVDRRAKRLHLDPAAMPMLKSLALLGDEEEKQALAGFSEGERVTLQALLERLIANVS